jgi:hypothetical protein
MLALPSTLYFSLLELAAGGLLVLLLVELRDEVPRGFSLFTGLALWLSAAAAWWLRVTFPPAATRPYPPDPTWLGVEQVLLLALLGLMAAYLGAVALRGGAIRMALGGLAGLAGAATLVAAGLVQAGPQLFGLGAPLGVVWGALALGAAMDALTLGHWYLVTPRLPEKPLLRMTHVLMLALVMQAVLLPIQLSFSANAEAALAELGVFFWLRFLFGVLFPLGVGVLVWKTASARSMQSATGLLYVLASLVAGGEIAARSIFFFTGLAV